MGKFLLIAWNYLCGNISKLGATGFKWQSWMLLILATIPFFIFRIFTIGGIFSLFFQCLIVRTVINYERKRQNGK